MSAQEHQPYTALPTELPKEIPAYAQHESPEGHSYSLETRPHTVKTILAWTAPGRPFRKRGKEFYVSSLLIALLIQVILFLFSQYALMAVVLSFVFVAFAFVTVPPHNFHYKISSEGITIEDHFFLWQELYDFYFKKKEGIDVLHIRTYALIPGELTLTLGTLDREHITSVILPYLPYREIIHQTFMEKSGNWLSKNFPLERQHS